jgi:hypothetical protein
MKSDTFPRSAAIIPFAFEALTQTVYILLAEVSRLGSSRVEIWGDLGGTIEAFERPESTAAREFIEESLGTISMLDCPELAENHLKVGRFFLKACIYFTSVCKTEYHREYYLKEVAFDPTACSRFTRVRNALLQLQECHSETLSPNSLLRHPTLSTSEKFSVPPEYLEKSAIQWFSLDHCIDLINNNGRLGTIRIRSSFLPALRTAVSELMRVSSCGVERKTSRS